MRLEYHGIISLMNSERRISRRTALKYCGAVVGLITITGCSGKSPDETQVILEKTANLLNKTANAIETAQQKFTATHTAQSEKAATTSAQIEETSTPFVLESDKENLKKIQETNGGEKISLENPLVSYVVKIPRPLTSDAVYAVLAIQENGKERGVGIIENFDCGLEGLEMADKLGDPIGSDKSPAISGLWKSNTRFENISGKMFVEASLGTVAVVTGNSYQLNKKDTPIECPKKSIFAGAGDLPEKLAREAGRVIKDVIEGFKEGYFEEK